MPEAQAMLFDEVRTHGDIVSFTPRVNTPAVRNSDPETSRQAALKVTVFKTALQEEVYKVVAMHPGGGLTPKEAENRPIFRVYGPSTIRKRFSELAAMGLIIPMGKRDGSTIYRAKGC